MPPYADSHINLPSSEEAAPVECRCAPEVLVWDKRRAEFQLINRVVSECGARPRWLSDEALCAEAEANRRGVLLVALEEQSASGASELRSVESLKGRGFKIICYGEGVSAWPVGKKCSALLAGALALLDTKGQDFAEELKATLERLLRAEADKAIEEEAVKREMRRLGVVGESQQMLAVFRWVLRASLLSDLPTLITGETGTGKELLVNAIFHLDEKRSRGPFVAVNCSAISPGLAESELFGHRRGAFTGAERDRRGLIRAADGGILFLDEIGDLDDALQAKLLRVLQEKRVLGVGDERETPVNVRVIAATNRNLEELVRQGRFRADLFHRLNTLSINLPPLRQRPGDLRPLILHFLEKYNALSGSRTLGVTAEFVEAMEEVELPGNARQLENLVRRALVNKDSDAPLNLSDLPHEVWCELSEQRRTVAPVSFAHEGTGEAASGAQSPAPAINSYMMDVLNLYGWNLSDSLAHCEKLLIESALQYTNGNQSQTARLLGITPRSVYNKVRKHHL